MAMSRSRLVSDRFPYLPVRLEVAESVQNVEALLDTGFDGDFSLPLETIASNTAPNGYQQWVLADGSTVLAPYYIGTLRMGETEVPGVLVTAVGNEPLLGRGAIMDLTVILDHGDRVIVEA